jgi:glycosyltransferase involved in cell wall biosynthesis
MLDYLKRCAASIADQEVSAFEHIVMDGDSTDGTREWLRKNPYPHMHSISEQDNGIYDAVNKGFKLAKGNILAYLNCDEQYLPGTLGFVKDYFDRHPQVDMIFGDLLLIRPDGSLVAFRKGYQPRWFYIVTSHLYVLSCTMFFRRKIIDNDFFFDTGFQTTGDADFVVRVLRSGYRARHVKRYMAAFTMTGKNLSNVDTGIQEQKQLRNSAPLYLRAMRLPVNALRFAEKFLSGAYFQKKPLEYSVYTTLHGPKQKFLRGSRGQFLQKEPPGRRRPKRKSFSVNNASFRWRFE